MRHTFTTRQDQILSPISFVLGGLSTPTSKPKSSAEKTWSRDEMLAAGIPEDRLGEAPLFDTLEGAAAALSPSERPSIFPEDEHGSLDPKDVAEQIVDWLHTFK